MNNLKLFKTLPFSVTHYNQLSTLTFLAAQERQSRRNNQRSVCGECPAAEGSGDNWATSENRGEEELPAGGEDL